MEVWNAISERDRLEIYEDVLFFLSKKEKVLFTVNSIYRLNNMFLVQELLYNMSILVGLSTIYGAVDLFIKS